jgi:hypothetical protein
VLLFKGKEKWQLGAAMAPGFSITSLLRIQAGSSQWSSGGARTHIRMGAHLCNLSVRPGELISAG